MLLGEKPLGEGVAVKKPGLLDALHLIPLGMSAGSGISTLVATKSPQQALVAVGDDLAESYTGFSPSTGTWDITKPTQTYSLHLALLIARRMVKKFAKQKKHTRS